MQEDEPKPSFVVFGRDVLKIPCFRNAFLYSISAYIGVGLTTFLFTSRPAFSSHVGFTAFVVVTFGYWTDCRLNYARNKAAMTQIQRKLHRAAVMEGTVVDPKVKRQIPKLKDLEDV